jgi:AcrR family transcriptional regulator
MTDDHTVRRGPGRPARSAAEIEEVRAQIAACALQLFQTEGYAAVSMRRLAEKSGFTVMTLYKYYARKIDVLRDLWTRVFEELFDELDAIAAAHIDPAERLLALAQSYVGFWLDRRDHYFLVFMSSGISQEDVSVFVQSDPLIVRFQVFLETLAAALALKPGDLEVRTKMDLLMATLHGVAHNQITISGYPWTDPDILVRAAIRALIAK